MNSLEGVSGGSPAKQPAKIEKEKKSSRDSGIGEISRRSIDNEPKEAKPLGDVTVLVGTSSVGKSSIIAALREYEPDLEESGPDLAGFQTVLAFLETQEIVPQEDYQFLKSVLAPKNNDIQILDAISGGKYFFKEGVSTEEKEKAISIAQKLKESTDEFAKAMDIETIMLNKVLAYSEAGKPAIFDTLFVDNVLKHNISKAPIKTVLVYCPFHELTNRLEKRNKEALEKDELSEIRPGPKPLFQFAELFGPKQDPTDKGMVVTRKEVEEDFDTNFNAWVDIEVIPSWKDLSKEEREIEAQKIESKRVEDKEKLLQALGFTDPKILKVELVPRKKYDGSIDTSTTKPHESAEILRKLHGK